MPPRPTSRKPVPKPTPVAADPWEALTGDESADIAARWSELDDEARAGALIILRDLGATVLGIKAVAGSLGLAGDEKVHDLIMLRLSQRIGAWSDAAKGGE